MLYEIAATGDLVVSRHDGEKRVLVLDRHTGKPTWLKYQDNPFDKLMILNPDSEMEIIARKINAAMEICMGWTSSIPNFSSSGSDR